jgi:hypothetical protein
MCITTDMIDDIYAAWHFAGVDVVGGNWALFVQTLLRQHEPKTHTQLTEDFEESAAAAHSRID